jgi:hypothetical protein
MFLVASPSIGFDDAGIFIHEFMCLKTCIQKWVGFYA